METLALQITFALERVDLTADLGRREARFRSVVQNSSDVLAVLDAEGVISYQSPSVQRLLGYAPDELIGTTLVDLVHPDDAASVRPFFEETVQLPELPTSIEWRLRHRDGSWRHTETAAANRLSDPEVAGLVLNIRDVSERKALERQLAHRAFHDALTNLANARCSVTASTMRWSAPSGPAHRLAWSCSTWITSRTSTTASGMPPVTSC